MKSKIRWNVWLDAGIFIAFAATAVTGVLLWLVLPEGKGSSYAIFLGITKSSWITVHDWAGVLMLTGILTHLVMHWEWIRCVSSRFLRKTSRQARINLSLDTLLGAVFLTTTVSGLVAWLALGGGYQGGRNPAYKAFVLGLARDTWNEVHLWTGVAVLAISLLHVVLHWKWIVCTTRNMLRPAICASSTGSKKEECAV
jgi:hypothetical protein